MAILDPIVEAIGWLLALFYSFVPNMGIAIILVTFTIMLLLYPLTAKQARSMIAMQMVQPEIKRIQAKYKNDRAKLNEEMMKFYQENKINPLAGCLPLLAQLPIFFALFTLLRSPYKYIPVDSNLYDAFCTTRQGAVVGVEQCSGDGRFQYLPTHQDFLGIDLSVAAPSQVSTWASFAAFAMVLGVMLSSFLQSRQAQKRTPAVNKQMAMVTKVLPVVFGLFSINFPAGLVLYYLVSNLWRLGQQEVIFRHVGTAADPRHKSLTKPAKSAVVDADSREREDTAVEVVDESPPAIEAAGSATRTTPKKRAGSKPAPKSTPAKGAPATGANGKAEAEPVPIPVAPAPRGRGGIRSLFQLPPPPGEVPSTAPPASRSATKPASKSTASSAAGSSASSGPRPGQAGRRTSKKKKKR